MKNTIVLLVLLITSFEVSSQVGQQWVRSYNGPINGFESPSCMAVDNAGNVYIGGRSHGSSFSLDYITIKYDRSGTQLWVARYDGPVSDTDYVTAIVIDLSGNVYVTGASKGTGTNFDYATVKYNSAGIQQWASRYNGPANQHDAANSIAADISGSIFVTGTSVGSGTGFDYATVKYNAAGVQQWASRFNGSANDEDQAITVMVGSLGNVVTAGTSKGTSGTFDAVTVGYNPSGIQMWANLYHNNTERVQCAVMDGDGYAIVTGWTGGPNAENSDVFIVKYNVVGNTEWGPNIFHDANGDIPSYVTVNSSSNIYVFGTTWHSPIADPNYFTLKYSPSGALQWFTRYHGPVNSGFDIGYSGAVDNLGNVYVTGESDGSSTGRDYATVKHNSDSVRQWVQRYNTGGNVNDYGYHMRVDGCQNVYVTGMSSNDIVTVRYSQFTPTAPTLSSPANNAINQPINLNLIWNRSQCAANYRLQVASDSLFTNMVINDSTLADTLRQVTGLGYNTNYWWRVNARTAAGTSSYSAVWKFRTTAPLGISLVSGEVPSEFRLHNNYPNPFNPVTKIRFDLPKSSLVKILIYDINGREAAILFNDQLNPGRYEINFDGGNLPSGVYFYKMETSHYSGTKRMILVK